MPSVKVSSQKCTRETLWEKQAGWKHSQYAVRDQVLHSESTLCPTPPYTPSTGWVGLPEAPEKCPVDTQCLQSQVCAWGGGEGEDSSLFTETPWGK